MVHGRLVAIDCKEIWDEEGRGVLSKSVQMSCSASEQVEAGNQEKDWKEWIDKRLRSPVYEE